MPKVRIIVRPTGAINGQYWPAKGECIDLPDAVAVSMVAAGHVELVPDEKPKAAEKPAAKIEKRPAPTRSVESRKG